jgi:hypothetical protein
VSEDFERIDPHAELDETAGDSWLPRWLIDNQEELAALSQPELAQRMADLVIAVALKDPGATPRGVLEELLADYAIDDDSWRGKVGPEIRRLLTARGVALPSP